MLPLLTFRTPAIHGKLTRANRWAASKLLPAECHNIAMLCSQALRKTNLLLCQSLGEKYSLRTQTTPTALVALLWHQST